MAAPGEEHLPSAEEMFDASKRQIWKMLADTSTPAHVMAKITDQALRLAVAERGDPNDGGLAIPDVFEMIESLPPARGIELIDQKLVTLNAERDALLDRRSRLTSGQTADASA